MNREKLEMQEMSTTLALAHIERFSSELAAATDLAEVCELCVVLIKEIFHLDFSTLFLLDDAGDMLRLSATAGFSQELVNTFTLQESQGLPGLVLEAGKVETVEDYRFESRFEVSPIVAELQIHSAIAAPMMVSDTVFGVLIGQNHRQRRYSGEEKQVYQVLANHAAISIANARHIGSLYISEEKRAKKIRELELEKEKNIALTNEFESIFSTITSGLMLMRQGRFLARCNEKMAEIFGYDSAAQMENMSTRDLHLSEQEYREFGRRYYDSLVCGKVVQAEYTLKKRDGTPILCRFAGRAVDQSIPPDLEKGFVWLIDDITRSRAMEEEVLRARKLESIGIMAGGIGHDFNNILSAILGNLGLAKRVLEPEHSIQEMLSAAIEAADRARDLTAKLLLFSRREGKVVGNTKLAELFAEYKFERMLGKKTKLRVELQDDLSPVRVLPDHLKAIMQNLLVNADASMPKGGRIYISGQDIDVEEDQIAGVSKGRYVELIVSDNGPGIAKDILENIFDPYFTTKARDSRRGSGLGLAIVHSIVKKNYGAISVRSSRETGTAFRILFPAAQKREVSR